MQLIQSGNENMRIDGGNNVDEETIKNYLGNLGITEFKYVVGTHAHEDHIGSLDYIMNSFKVGKIYFQKTTSSTKTFDNLVKVVQSKGIQFISPSVGETFNLGDAEDISEKEMLKNGLDLKADVLKAGHYGSKSYSSDEFLDAVNPKYSVISVGKDNDYGHPNAETLQKFSKRGIEVYRTDESGTVVAESDGNNISFIVAPSQSNKCSSQGSKGSDSGPVGSSNSSMSAGASNTSSDYDNHVSYGESSGTDSSID